ncbi:MAG: hypothetical protein MUO26_11260 [Methanotrichaceae archaeon]|nr:hypothetical protein [Methanotrichaceae archaeon]
MVRTPRLCIIGLNTIPEVFDAEIPHKPGECVSQAGSAAEIIRAWDLIQSVES